MAAVSVRGVSLRAVQTFGEQKDCILHTSHQRGLYDHIQGYIPNLKADTGFTDLSPSPRWGEAITRLYFKKRCED